MLAGSAMYIGGPNGWATAMAEQTRKISTKKLVSLFMKRKNYKNNKNLMLMKCSICSKTVDTTFLGKLLGTYVKDSKGKLHAVCFECQKKFALKEEILKAIK